MLSERGAAWWASQLDGQILPRAKQDEHSAAGREGSHIHPVQGGPKPPAEPQTHFSTSETSHLFPVFSFALPEGGRFPTELDLQEELFLKHLPPVNRDFARGSRSCVSSRSSLLEMPLPSLQSPPFLPLSVPLPAFFSFFLVFHFPQSQ